MTDVAPSPPASSTWDLAEVTAKALAVLRLSTGDADEGRIGEAAEAATVLVDAFLDNAAAGAVTPPMLAAAVQVTVELYRRKDAPFGVVDAWSQDTIAFRISGDPLAGVLMTLLPEKSRWGIG